MSLNLDDVVIGGQLKVGVGVCPPINEGDKRINGSMLCEGPVVLGGSTEFSDNLATLMVGRTKNDDCEPADRSLYVKGDVKIEGDGGSESSPNTTLHIDSSAATYGIQITAGGYILLRSDGDAVFSKGTSGLALSTRFSIADALGKAFDMPHPTKGKGHRLSHACIEGPEIGVYIVVELEMRR